MLKFILVCLLPISCFADGLQDFASGPGDNVHSANVIYEFNTYFISEFQWNGHSYFVVDDKMLMHDPECERCYEKEQDAFGSIFKR